MADVEVKDGIWKKLLAQVRGLDKITAKVGVLASKGGSELHDEDSDLTIVELAAIHEFGSPKAGVPERSFIRRTFAEPEGQSALKEKCAELARAVVTKGMDPVRAVGLLGSWGAAAVKNRITKDVIPPPNAPSTVAAKGSSRPLVDTGRLVSSITYEVVDDRDGGDPK